MSTKVLIADDHVILRKGLWSLMEESFDLEVVGEACDGLEAVSLAECLFPDVMVLDLMMPGRNGLEVIQVVKQCRLRTEIVVFSMHRDISYVIRALRAGALGYVLKNSPSHELIDAIRTVSTGHSYVCSALTDLVPASTFSKGEKKPVEPFASLTAREQEVFALVGQGLTSEEIARRLEISRRTVETHRYNLGHKLNVKNPIDLVRMALEYGLCKTSSI